MNSQAQISELKNASTEAHDVWRELLEGTIRELELTPAQQEDVERRYQAVGDWLIRSDSQLFTDVEIEAQGSQAIGTTIKPPRGDEFDLDAVCLLRNQTNAAPGVIYNAVGDRLRENATYRGMLSEKNRCLRLSYSEATRFHMDITPAVPNPHCSNDGVNVPDNERREWSPSNPRGYASWFNAIAEVEPRILTLKEHRFADARGDVAPIPEYEYGHPLRRAVQLLKRHRDLYFHNTGSEDKTNKPISVLLTTLAAWSYHDVVHQDHVTWLSLVVNIVQLMPDYIERHQEGSQTVFVVRNPSTTDFENFAERWNENQELPKAFYRWHQRVMKDLQLGLRSHGTLESFYESARGAFGDRLVTLTERARQAGNLGPLGSNLSAAARNASVISGLAATGAAGSSKPSPDGSDRYA